MRRLWAHIILAATSLTMVGATFATVVTNIDSNIEFNQGNELVFRVNNKESDGTPDLENPLEKKDLDYVKEIAHIMENRLETLEISRYKVEVQGYDTIKVSLTQESSSQYDILKNYLPFNASLALSNSEGTYATSNEFLNPDKKAYLEITDGYPAVVIPINKDNDAYQAVYTGAKTMNDENRGEVVEEHEHEEGEEEHEETRKAYLYLWYDFVEDYYSYDKIDQKKTDTYDQNVASKILMTFDVANPFLDENEDALRAYITPANSEESQEVTPDALKSAYENARYYVNLLNADEINSDYTVSYLFSKKIDSWVDNLITLDNHMSVNFASRTFYATICALVVVSLLLVYFYRLGALSIVTTSVTSTFFGLLFIVLFGAEFNMASIVGLIALGLTSVISGIIYGNKLKEECYRGRSLKKANSEAAKKALLPTIDVHVVLVAVGVACYLLGGVIMKGFALATIIGGLVSLVLNIFGLRGLMWLVTNEQGLNNRYDLFDVNKDQVPNALEEEKQKYFGPNADKDFTKHKKPVMFASLALLLASVTMLIVRGAMFDGAVYGKESTTGSSQVYVEYHSNFKDDTALSSETKASLVTMLDHAYLVEGDKATKLSSISEIESYDYTTIYKMEAGEMQSTYYAYYRIDFKNTLIKDNAVISYRDENGNQIFANEAYLFFDLENGDVAKTTGANLPFDVTVKTSLKNSERINADQPKFTSLILATAVAGGIISLYLLLRYRLTRGLASLGITTLVVGISAGLFALLFFVPATSYISVALPFIALFTYDIAILFMNKEREMILDDRTRDNSVEARNALMVKATALSSTPIMVSFIIALYLGVNFFGFMFTSVSWIFLLAILGVSIATALVLVLYGPLSQLLFKWFSNVNIKKPEFMSKKKKARPARVKKSAEPEEAIFIGIND